MASQLQNKLHDLSERNAERFLVCEWVRHEQRDWELENSVQRHSRLGGLRRRRQVVLRDRRVAAVELRLPVLVVAIEKQLLRVPPRELLVREIGRG